MQWCLVIAAYQGIKYFCLDILFLWIGILALLENYECRDADINVSSAVIGLLFLSLYVDPL